jgi:ethanolamine utilization protein EutQ
MTDIRLFRRAAVTMDNYGEGPGLASIARLVGPDSSRTMGAYLGRFDGRSVAWTVQYDEVIVGIEGLFRLRAGDEVYELGPGDVLWIGEGRAVRYEGDKALVFMAISPVNWRALRPPLT